MIAGARKQQSGRSLFAIALALALFVRILIPTGFMPTATPRGMVVELCSGHEGQKVVIDLGKTTPSKKPYAADAPCVFAAGLGQGLLPVLALAVLGPDLVWPIVPVGPIFLDHAPNRLAAPPPPSQGPPTLR